MTLNVHSILKEIEVDRIIIKYWCGHQVEESEIV